ncbi:histidine kinase dimerization/phospho-acceptor domain-containing protein [Arthrobacter sp. OVS8]|nr:histidine kinase dimerization/phospho-acceptor domain-containing protein [Arthrobacter sp. OVS8]
MLFGRILPASDRRLLGAFGVHLNAQLERQQLAASRRQMLRLAESNTIRTSILRAVSHDLRTPLAGIKLAVGGLRHDGARYTPDERQELLATIEECSDRLDGLVGNLLDMSRISADAAHPCSGPCAGTRSFRTPCAPCRRDVSGWNCPPTCLKSTRTPECLSASLPTSSKTP